MLPSVLRHMRRNVVAYVALFIALGGSSYAAIKLPANSVGSRQLRKGAVTASKVKPHSLLAKDFKTGQIKNGAQGPAGVNGATGPQGPPGHDGTSGTTGPTGPSYWTALTKSVPTLALNNFYYGAVQGVSTATATEDNVSMLSPAEDVVARNLTVQLSAAPGSGNFVHIVMDNGQSVGLNCVVDDPATTCSDPGPHSIPAGSLITWSISGVTASGFDARITFETIPAS
jgi:hypothetical protein